MKTVLVVGRAWKFRALLRAQLREENYDALGFATLEEAADQLAAGSPPAALVFDSTDASPAVVQPQLAELARRLPVLVIAGAQDSFDFSPDKRRESTAPRVLRRPLRLEEVVAAIKAAAPL